MVRDGLASDGGREHRTIVDFTDRAAVGRAADEHAASHGPVHVLVNNTGGPAAGFAIDADPGDFEKAFAMHLSTAQAMTQAFAGMRAAGYGRIINVISTSVVTPIRGLGGATRPRGHKLGPDARRRVNPFGIGFNSPGFTDTQRLASLFEGKARRAGAVDEVRVSAVAQIPPVGSAMPARSRRRPCSSRVGPADTATASTFRSTAGGWP